MTKKHIGSTALKAGALFGIAMGVMNGVRSGMSAGIASGIAMGIAFAGAIAGLMFWQHSKADAWRAEFKDEGLQRDAPANHGSGGGWLFLTQKRLVWRANALSVGSKRVEILLADITGVTEKARKIEVHTTSGVKRFLVRESDAWATAIAPALPTARVVDR